MNFHSFFLHLSTALLTDCGAFVPASFLFHDFTECDDLTPFDNVVLWAEGRVNQSETYMVDSDAFLRTVTSVASKLLR